MKINYYYYIIIIIIILLLLLLLLLLSLLLLAPPPNPGYATDIYISDVNIEYGMLSIVQLLKTHAYLKLISSVVSYAPLHAHYRLNFKQKRELNHNKVKVA